MQEDIKITLARIEERLATQEKAFQELREELKPMVVHYNSIKWLFGILLIMLPFITKYV